MNLYEKYLAKQQEIIDCIQKQEELESELNAIKREIYKAHIDRFKKKPIGKTTILDNGHEITYNRLEKIKPLVSLIQKDGLKSECFVEKVTPEKRTLAFSKTKYNKLSDNEKSKIDNYISKELSDPVLVVKPIE